MRSEGNLSDSGCDDLSCHQVSRTNSELHVEQSWSTYPQFSAQFFTGGSLPIANFCGGEPDRMDFAAKRSEGRK